MSLMSDLAREYIPTIFDVLSVNKPVFQAKCRATVGLGDRTIQKLKKTEQKSLKMLSMEIKRVQKDIDRLEKERQIFLRDKDLLNKQVINRSCKLLNGFLSKHNIENRRSTNDKFSNNLPIFKEKCESSEVILSNKKISSDVTLANAKFSKSIFDRASKSLRSKSANTTQIINQNSSKVTDNNLKPISTKSTATICNKHKTQNHIRDEMSGRNKISSSFKALDSPRFPRLYNQPGPSCVLRSSTACSIRRLQNAKYRSRKRRKRLSIHHQTLQKMNTVSCDSDVENDASNTSCDQLLKPNTMPLFNESSNAEIKFPKVESQLNSLDKVISIASKVYSETGSSSINRRFAIKDQTVESLNLKSNGIDFLSTKDKKPKNISCARKANDLPCTFDKGNPDFVICGQQWLTNLDKRLLRLYSRANSDEMKNNVLKYFGEGWIKLPEKTRALVCFLQKVRMLLPSGIEQNFLDRIASEFKVTESSSNSGIRLITYQWKNNHDKKFFKNYISRLQAIAKECNLSFEPVTIISCLHPNLAKKTGSDVLGAMCQSMHWYSNKSIPSSTSDSSLKQNSTYSLTSLPTDDKSTSGRFLESSSDALNETVSSSGISGNYLIYPQSPESQQKPSSVSYQTLSCDRHFTSNSISKSIEKHLNDIKLRRNIFTRYMK